MYLSVMGYYRVHAWPSWPAHALSMWIQRSLCSFATESFNLFFPSEWNNSSLFWSEQLRFLPINQLSSCPSSSSAASHLNIFLAGKKSFGGKIAKLWFCVFAHLPLRWDDRLGTFFLRWNWNRNDELRGLYCKNIKCFCSKNMVRLRTKLRLV